MSKGVICLTRTLGDVVIGNVLVKNVKLRHPELELDYIVEDKYSALLEDNPNIANLIKLKSTYEEWDKVLQMFAFGKYDKIFIPQQASATDNSWHQNPQYNDKHLLSFYAERCGIQIVDPKLELFVSDFDLGNKIPDKHPLVCLHTKTLADAKDWSGFTELSSILRNELGLKVVQLGLPTDTPILGVEKLNLSLKELMLFFKKGYCDLFIGLDSGLTYMATAFEVPLIALYGATLVRTSGVYGKNVHTISSEQNEECKRKRGGIRCHGINGGKCFLDFPCINNITVNQVVEKVREVILKKGV